MPIIGGPPRAVTIGATSTLILQANSARKKVYLVNDATEEIYIARADGVALNTGIRLNAAGGSFYDERDTWGEIYTGPYYGICTSGGMNLCVEEDY